MSEVKRSGVHFSIIKWSWNICEITRTLNWSLNNIRAFIFLSTYDLTNVPAWINDRKIDARPFDTILDILRCISLVQFLLKGLNAPFWFKREPTYMRLSGTDRLRGFIPYFGAISLMEVICGRINFFLENSQITGNSNVKKVATYGSMDCIIFLVQVRRGFLVHFGWK